MRLETPFNKETYENTGDHRRGTIDMQIENDLIYSHQMVKHLNDLTMKLINEDDDIDNGYVFTNKHVYVKRTVGGLLPFGTARFDIMYNPDELPVFAKPIKALTKGKDYHVLSLTFNSRRMEKSSEVISYKPLTDWCDMSRLNLLITTENTTREMMFDEDVKLENISYEYQRTPNRWQKMQFSKIIGIMRGENYGDFSVKTDDVDVSIRIQKFRGTAYSRYRFELMGNVTGTIYGIVWLIMDQPIMEHEDGMISAIVWKKDIEDVSVNIDTVFNLVTNFNIPNDYWS